MKKIIHTYEEVISLENLLAAWQEFIAGKKLRVGVREFSQALLFNILSLRHDLNNKTYKHSRYQSFTVNDPKTRTINKAAVRDRLLHRAIYRTLYPAFDRTFIFDSYSCRVGKGTHKAFARLRQHILSCSQNYTQPCFAMKCDIRRFFDSIDHEILLGLIGRKVIDIRLLDLLTKVVRGFEVQPGKGMPIGNLTSQLFANIYLDPLDKFVKHRLKAHYYLRYADDFLILANTKEEIMGYFVEIWRFLKEELKLQLHPSKLSLHKLTWGIDFVGYVALPHYALPRRKTVKRIFRHINLIENRAKLSAALDSYIGYLKHVDAFALRHQLNESVYRRYIKY